MKDINFNDALSTVYDHLKNGGVFLTVAGEPANTMTIAWATMGYCWNKPVFVALVRPQRHTYPLLMKSGAFTISVPTRNPLKKELAFAGSKSGRDLNKFDGHGLTAAPAQEVGAPIIAECGLHLECRVLLKQDMTADQMSPSIIDMTYRAGDFHTMFYGEIVRAYTTD
ncbi:MAG: flavin reductase family protein [Christensenellales bacterium]|jgi:flavin reductase (DIM6/NTAB) family NADH-FMN oxidoreductase RutF